MEESTAKLERSIAAPMIFIIVVALQFLSRYFEINKKKGSTSSEDMQLRAEIKQLLKEASALLQPSTFAQAAKLRRLATAKERELAINQEIRSKEAKLSYDTQKALLFCSSYSPLARCCHGELEVLPMKMLWWGLFRGCYCLLESANLSVEEYSSGTGK